jgi:hypothetical protein
MKLSIERLQKIWEESLGFLPTAVASFDHITTGLPSRLLTGYIRFGEFCRAHKLDAWRALSVVIDTVVAKREVPCGVSAELGFLPNEQTVWVENPNAFFFRTGFRMDFEGVRSEFRTSVEKSLHGLPLEDSLAHLRRATGWFEVFRKLWNPVTSCKEILIARKQLFDALGYPMMGKRRLLSELLPTVARVLEEIQRQGFSLSECPGVDEAGFVRTVRDDGTEGEILKEWEDSLLEMVQEKKAVPTAPLAVLALSLPFPHFGNDYGIFDRLVGWLGLDSGQMINVEDFSDSWPVMEVVIPKSEQKLHSLWLDLCWWENYLQMVELSLLLKGTQGPFLLNDWGKRRL